jgi:hypothetical protein
MSIKSILFILILLAAFQSTAQNSLKGQVIDSVSGEALAFVNIIYNSQKQGVATDIDGSFQIENSKIDYLKISYLGYKPLFINKADISKNERQIIRLSPLITKLQTVEVFPGENPAHRIIKKCVKNRNLNNPEKISSFSYDSYEKLIVTLNVDSTKLLKIDSLTSITDTTKTDSSFIKLQEFLGYQHAFISETVSERKFIKPDKNSEKILASRMSGFKTPFFTFMADQFQPFSFYKELITISDKTYINPISKGSTRKYFFLIEDTVYTPRNDTVFIISFRPRKGKNFDGLKGFLHINTHKYAIQNVKAEPVEQHPSIGIRMQQKYELINDSLWFPVQLNTDILFNSFNIELPEANVGLIGIGKTYITNISLDPDLEKKDFNNIEVDFETNAYDQDSVFWAEHRIDSLTCKDKNTYHVIDSIGKELNLDRFANAMEAIMLGYIPYKFLNIDYTKLIGFNKYEGFKIGVGALTNNKVSEWFSIGGHIVYGFKDKDIKYGGKFDLKPFKYNDIILKLRYNKGVRESSGINFHLERNPLSTESYRELYIEYMDIFEEYEAGFGFRAFQYLSTNIYYKQELIISTDNYLFNSANDIYTNAFEFEEAGIQIKYHYKEKFMKTPKGKYSLGSKYPILWFNYSHGINSEYNKYELKFHTKFKLKNIGDISIQTIGGYVDNDLPFPKLYNGHGSFSGQFPLDVEYSFATMRMSEFLNSRFAFLFYKHDLGSLLFKTKNFQPKISLVQNIGYGSLDFKENHYNRTFNTMEKGYFESGILFSNVLKMNYIGYGIGAYYRYGPYMFESPKDNIAFRLTFGYYF